MRTRWQGLRLLLFSALLASHAAAEDRERLARAVASVAQAVRSDPAALGPALAILSPENREALRRLYGPDATRAVGAMRLADVPSVDTPAARDDALADFLGAQPELAELAGAGLARALHQADAFYAGRGLPLPEAVKVILSISFPREVLDGARVIVTGTEANLPALVNQVQASVGDAVGGVSAVTIGDLVTFSEIPEASAVDFWAHELQHVVQYRRLGGIDAFAAVYSTDYRKLEDDANAVAGRALREARDVLTVIHALAGESTAR
ncbi:MAG TPA: DUF4157 domain-containing protein [Myxococcota bacterium]|nr:DUF4157 domain-containing protein [Myxococcota bacterium]